MPLTRSQKFVASVDGLCRGLDVPHGAEDAVLVVEWHERWNLRSRLV